jgi:hypothetical protein
MGRDLGEVSGDCKVGDRLDHVWMRNHCDGHTQPVRDTRTHNEAIGECSMLLGHPTMLGLSADILL